MPYVLNTQENIYVSLKTPLGDKALMLAQVEGVETLSECFEFNLDMYAIKSDVDFAQVLGKSATITLKQHSGTRYINGIITEFVQGLTVKREQDIVTFYKAKLRPQFWMLTLTSNCRIFQNKSSLDIIKSVLSENKVTDIEDKTSSRGKEILEYCVQYDESDLNFISRLLEKHGIFYFFTHTAEKHTLVLADSNESFQDCPHAATAKYHIAQPGNTPYASIVTNVTLLERVVPSGYALDDFNFEMPKTSLYSKTAGKGEGGLIYTYPGGYEKKDKGEIFSALRIQAEELPQRNISTQTTIPFFTPGFKFKLENHPRQDLNIAYVLKSIHHKIKEGTLTDKMLYENEATAFPFNTPFKPPLKARQPKIYGSQTAIVTGKNGEEIWTDKYGRIKVKFHWDRSEKNDETTSCWIRVMQPWSGSGWGHLFIPRIGHEVVVSFLNGDPDRPLITGSVYNADNLPPYLPNEPTKSTIKSNTSKGGKGFNEMRFNDEKDKEEYYMHAQKDMNIDVINDQTTKIEKGNRTVQIQAKGDKEGNDTLEITKGNRTFTITKGNETHTLKEGNRTISLENGNEDHTLKKGNYTLKITGNLEISATGSVTIKAGTNMTLKAGTNMTVQAGANLEEKAGASFNMQANATMEAKANAGVTVQTPAVLTLKGSLTKIN